MDVFTQFRWREALVAVLGGNVAYFLVVDPFLPETWRHQPFRPDPGLAIDFLVCLGLYAGIVLAKKKRQSG